MLKKSGYKIVWVAEVPWQNRLNVDGWPSRAGATAEDGSRDTD